MLKSISKAFKSDKADKHSTAASTSAPAAAAPVAAAPAPATTAPVAAPSTTTMSTPSNALSEGFFAAVENRRSYYGLKKESPISDAEIEAIVKRCVKHSPNSFNMQQSRAVVVTGKYHELLWNKVAEISDKNSPDAEQAKSGRDKIEGSFKAGYGTVLFYEDQEVLKKWCEMMPAYAEGFKIWSEDAAGILQYVVWTALEANGLGASLQHYASIFGEEAQTASVETFGLPAHWKCTAMMPFGTPAGPPGNPAHPKEFAPLEDRVKTFLG